MEPLFTIHAGEFLVGEHINRKLGKKYDVWIPTKDDGVDLLVTSRNGRRRAVGIQVKFSRGYDIHKKLVGYVLATSWYTLKPSKIRQSNADLWVFVILTERHERHFVVVPVDDLRARIPANCGPVWHLCLCVLPKRKCCEVRGLGTKETQVALSTGEWDPQLDYSVYLENWEALDESSR